MVMSKLPRYLFLLFVFSCTSTVNRTEKEIITVSIPPFRYFVDVIAGGDYDINVMVPPGTDPHIFEPTPGQITRLSRSVAYISNGYLDFEVTWLDRFYATNREMKKLTLGKDIDVIKSEGHHHEGQVEGADPHFWVSPKGALTIAASVKSLLVSLNPGNREKYETSFRLLADTIFSYDRLADSLFSAFKGKEFLIFHPALGYLARDYGIEQVSVETEGKEPHPSQMKELIDRGKRENIKVIFVQKGFDTKNPAAIASEIGAEIKIIDPLDENWPGAVSDIVRSLHRSFLLSTR